MGSLLTFVNAVADEVAKTHPDVLVGTLAYQYSRKPPKHLRPRPNVQIQLCSIECCVTHAIDDPDCPLNTPFCEDMKAWGQISDQISVWHYNTNFANYLLPSPNLSAIAPSIRYFVKHHARGVMMQGAYGSTGAEFADLRNYVTSRLLWNPSLDGDALIEEFLTLHYEAAADPIRDMLTTIYQQADASGKHERISRPGHLYGYDRALAEKSFEYIQQAKALAPNDTIRSRVEKLELYVTAMMVDALLDTDQPRTIYHRIYRKLAVAPHLSPEQLAEARPYIKHMFELAEHHHATMTSEWMTTAQAKAAFNAIHAPTGFERDEAAAADSD